ncbi:hypothetical protein TSAR_004315 [Trichomalopsis sarcophagae]|uniref:Uncharacterized protein n=1 Tax=Trichomalopsis sarcophagae TaxID=543379 RepID=A0A232F7L4_9HYME|nr:hypothetical protein TSAR_004315 [Trichomalopsis sarcophagae]
MDLESVNIYRTLRYEADCFKKALLVKRLMLCKDLAQSSSEFQ